jgi:hypothetical protein
VENEGNADPRRMMISMSNEFTEVLEEELKEEIMEELKENLKENKQKPTQEYQDNTKKLEKT